MYIFIYIHINFHYLSVQLKRNVCMLSVAEASPSVFLRVLSFSAFLKLNACVFLAVYLLYNLFTFLEKFLWLTLKFVHYYLSTFLSVYLKSSQCNQNCMYKYGIFPTACFSQCYYHSCTLLLSFSQFISSLFTSLAAFLSV